MSFAPLALNDRRGRGLYAESQLRSDCYLIWLNMHSHSREATVMPRRRGVAASYIIYGKSILTPVPIDLTDTESLKPVNWRLMYLLLK